MPHPLVVKSQVLGPVEDLEMLGPAPYTAQELEHVGPGSGRKKDHRETDPLQRLVELGVEKPLDVRSLMPSRSTVRRCGMGCRVKANLGPGWNKTFLLGGTVESQWCILSACSRVEERKG